VQQAEDRLTRQNNWNLALQVGVHEQVNPLAQGAQPYGSFSLTYNLASRSIDEHLDRAATAYGNWKQVQEGDVIRNLQVLHQQLDATIDADEAKEQSLEAQMKEIYSNLRVVASPDTSAAVDFRNQLDAARLLLQVEFDDTAFRLSRLRDYCARNF
jgi:predicted metal-dependent peptidase